MRSPFLRLAVASATLAAFGAFGVASCDYTEVIWFCLNPVTGKLDDAPYDENHFVNGKADPCHCYDPCGPEKTCPIVVDAGEPGPGCDAGSMGDGG